MRVAVVHTISLTVARAVGLLFLLFCDYA